MRSAFCLLGALVLFALQPAGWCDAAASTTPLFEGDSLATAFNIPEPVTSFDTSEGAMRPRKLDRPVRFRIPATALRPKLTDEGRAQVTWSGDGKSGSPDTCTLFVLKPIPVKAHDASYEFDVEIATWDIINAPPSTEDPRHPTPLRTCGKFETVDPSGTYHLRCSITNCDATVADFKKIFAPTTIELVEVGAPDTTDASADEQATGEETVFEAAPTRTKRARKPASTAKLPDPAAASGATGAQTAAAPAMLGRGGGGR